jgi:hypothetical protein
LLLFNGSLSSARQPWKRSNILQKHSSIPLFLPRETFFYFTGAMIEAEDQTADNTPYFSRHGGIEIPGR